MSSIWRWWLCRSVAAVAPLPLSSFHRRFSEVVGGFVWWGSVRHHCFLLSFFRLRSGGGVCSCCRVAGRFSSLFVGLSPSVGGLLLWVSGFGFVFYVFVMLLLQRLGVATDLWPILRWLDSKTRKGRCGIQNPQGLVRLTRKGMVINILDSSLDLSSYTCLFETVVFGGMIFSINWYHSRFVEICRFWWVISTFTLLLLRRAIYDCCWSGSCWHLDFDTVLAVDPFAILKL